jgi:hypothetical protein
MYDLGTYLTPNYSGASLIDNSESQRLQFERDSMTFNERIRKFLEEELFQPHAEAWSIQSMTTMVKMATWS